MATSNPDFKFPLLDLEAIIDAAVKDNTSIQCNENDLIAIGNFVALSSLVKDKNNCLVKKLQTIKIYAYDTVLIDADIKKAGQQTDVIIIAPKWYIQDKHIIDLKGLPAEDISTPAENGAFPGVRGNDGSPGNPGAPGGNFLGLAAVIVNSQNLDVNVSGGSGGKGQDAGNGADGFSVDLINTNQWPAEDSSTKKFMNAVKLIKNYNSTVIQQISNKRMGTRYSVDDIAVFPIVPCSRGGKGGDGGRGGYGGHPGCAYFISTKQNNDVHLQANQGASGIGGNLGKGGNGSRCGARYVWRIKTESNVFQSYLMTKRQLQGVIDLDFSSPGFQGYFGLSSSGIKQPQKPRQLDASENINEYKNFIRLEFQNPKSKVQPNTIANFLYDLNYNATVRSFESTNSYVRELLYLEKEINNEAINRTIYLSFYESFVERVETYAKHPKLTDQTLDHKIVLLRLYTAGISKIIDLKEYQKTSLVIDISNYLQLTKRYIDEIAEIKTKQMKFLQKESYQESIDKKIQEANHLISDELTKEIEQIYDNMNKKVITLVAEVRKLQQITKEETEELVKAQIQMGTALRFKRLFGMMKMMGTAFEFLGHWGRAAGAIIHFTFDVAESFIDEDLNKDVPSPEIPEGVHLRLDHAQKSLEIENGKRIAALKDAIKFIKTELTKNVDRFKDMIQKLEKIEIEVNGLKDLTNMLAIEKMQKNLEDLFTQQKDELHYSGSTSEQGAAEKKVLQHLENVSKVTHLAYDEYANYDLDNPEEMNKATKQLNKAYKNFQKLNEFEQVVYNTVVPMLSNMRGKMENVRNNLKQKSQVNLKIAQWKVQEAIKTIKTEMQHLVKGFEMGESLVQVFEKQEQAMTLVIDIYDKIQSYENEKTLGDYIHAMNSQADEVSSISPQLRQNVYEVELVIRKNMILQYYDQYINSIKLYLFPFAKYYLASIELPPSKNMDELVSRVKGNLELIQEKISLYKTTIKTGIDQHSVHQIYNNDYAFAEWSHDLHGLAIAKLLAGEKVLFKADLNQNTDQNAVKMNVVSLSIVTRNSTLLPQKDIDTIIKPFKFVLDHSGYSHFRCNKDYYTITHPSQSIEASFVVENKEPISQNAIYRKIKEGDLLLSPYTYWTISLEKLKKNVGDMEKLKSLAGKVDLKLTGQGHYVDPESDICGSDLQKYYQIDGTIGDSDEEETFNGFSNEFKSVMTKRNRLVTTRSNEIPTEKTIPNPRNKRHAYLEKSVVDFSDFQPVNSKGSSMHESSLINYIMANLMMLQLTNIVYKLPGYLKQGVDYFSSGFWDHFDGTLHLIDNHSSYSSDKFDYGNSVSFYDSVNSWLILFPIFKHTWNKLMGKRSASGKFINVKSFENGNEIYVQKALLNGFITYGDAENLDGNIILENYEYNYLTDDSKSYCVDDSVIQPKIMQTNYYCLNSEQYYNGINKTTDSLTLKWF